MSLLTSEPARYHFTKPKRKISKEITELIELAKDNDAYICGGYARYLASPNENPIPASDIDIFCRDERSYDRTYTAIVKKYKATVRQSRFASNLTIKELPDLPVQLIRPTTNGLVRNYGKVYDVLDTFDFSVARACVVSPKSILVHKDFLIHEESKILQVVAPLHNPFRIFMRACKYMTKGYDLPPVEIVRLLTAWENYSDDYKTKLMGTFAKIDGEGKRRGGFGFGRSIPVTGEMSREEVDDMYELFWGTPK